MIQYHLYIESKKNANELIYQVETDSQTLKSNLWVPKEKGEGGMINRKVGINIYILLCIK